MTKECVKCGIVLLEGKHCPVCDTFYDIFEDYEEHSYLGFGYCDG